MGDSGEGDFCDIAPFGMCPDFETAIMKIVNDHVNAIQTIVGADCLNWEDLCQPTDRRSVSDYIASFNEKMVVGMQGPLFVDKRKELVRALPPLHNIAQAKIGQPCALTANGSVEKMPPDASTRLVRGSN